MRSSGQSSRCSGRQESGNRGSRRSAASRDGLTASSVSDGPAMLPAGLAVVPARAVPAADCSCVVGPAARVAGAADFSGSAVQLAVSAGLDVGLAGPAVAASSVSARTAAGRVVAVAVCSDSAVGPVVAAASADFAVLVATERAVVAAHAVAAAVARAVVVASLLAWLPFVPVVRTQGQSQPKIRTILPFRSLQISSLKVPQLQARRRVHK